MNLNLFAYLIPKPSKDTTKGAKKIILRSFFIVEIPLSF